MATRIEISHAKTGAAAPPVMPSACQSGGCGGGPSPSMPPPVGFGEVRVNGVEIEPEAIAEEIQHHPAPDPQTAWLEAARALAVRELLLQEARRLDVVAEAEADDAGRTDVEEDALIAALLDQAIEPDMPSDEECRRYYEARRDRFRTPDLFEVAHILLEPEGEGENPWSEAEARARVIAEELGDDPAAFAEAAREFSACPSARQDGSLGQVRRGELVPSIQAAVEALEPGHTMPEPVRSRFGWHVLRLHRRIEGQVLPFEAVQAKVAEMLAARSWTVASTRYVAGLAAGAALEGITIEAAA